MKTSLAHILKGTGTEMFVCDDEALIVHERSVMSISDAPASVKDKLIKFIKADAKREQAYISLAGTDVDAQLSQCVKCMFANLDGVPDIDQDGNINSIEYVSCPKRGVCAFEGVACNKLVADNGTKISDGELRVLEMYPLEEKEIADKLFLSPATVKRHSQNIRTKTGITSGKKLALWAFNKGVINQNQIWS
jgi:hypothetical protein